MSDEVSRILEKNLGEAMLVSLKSRGRLRGRLDGFDEHLNLVLTDAEYLSDASDLRKLGSIILRGDNIVTVLHASEVHRTGNQHGKKNGK
jgi:small nuclear ribonucleoprotein